MTPRVVGLATGTRSVLNSELAAAAAAALSEDLGIAVRWVSTPREAGTVDLVIGIGDPLPYPALWTGSAHIPRVVWIGEPLPPADESAADWIFRNVRLGRVLDAALAAATVRGRRFAPPALSRLRERAAYAYDWSLNVQLHDAAARAGMRIVVTSRDRSLSLAQRGISAPVVPFGYHPALAGEPADPADPKRDIDVLVLGTAVTGVPTRRARIIGDCLKRLPPAVRTRVVQDGLWGTERAEVLRRTKVVLNVHRAPGNFEGIRLILAAAAGALVITDPVATPDPFLPGRHYVEALGPRLAEAIVEHLADGAKRLKIARAAQAFVVEDLTMRRSIKDLLEGVA